jgi:glycosyltransferase involved in cell wall biosynthesis
LFIINKVFTKSNPLLPDEQKNFPSIKHSIKHSIIIPAYNEEKGLPVVIEKIVKIIDDSFEILVVNDGSTDNTALVAQKYPCRLINHHINQGKGKAMKTGVQQARGENVLFIDADDTYPAEVILDIAEALEDYDYAVASRSIGKQNIPAFNRIGNAIFRNSIRYIYGFKAYDPLTGLYGIKKSYFEKMELRSKGFGIESEIAIKAASMGLKIKDIPIVYGERIGEAKLNGLKDGYKIARTIISHLPLYNSTLTFILPGILLFLGGLIGLLFYIRNADLGAGIISALLLLAGFQIGTFGFASKVYAMAHKYSQTDIFTRFLLQPGIRWKLTSLGAVMVLFSIIAGGLLFSENISLASNPGIHLTELASASELAVNNTLSYGQLSTVAVDKAKAVFLLPLLISGLLGLLLIFSATFLSIFTAGLSSSGPVLFKRSEVAKIATLEKQVSG